MHTHACTCTHMHAWTHACTHARCIHTHIHTRTHTHTHARTHAHTHTHTHTLISTWKWRMSVHTSPRVSLGLPSTRDSFCMFTSLIWRNQNMHLIWRNQNMHLSGLPTIPVQKPSVLSPGLCHCPVIDCLHYANTEAEGPGDPVTGLVMHCNDR